MLKLDDRDLKILKVLAREGRMSKTELADRINLSPSPAWKRLKRLEKAGVIAGYHAEIALKSVAKHVTVFVTVELERHRAENFAAFEREVAGREEIVACWALGGGLDYLLQIVSRDLDSYQRLIDSLLEQGLGLARYYTYVVTKPVKSGWVPPIERLIAVTEEADSVVEPDE